MPVIVQEPQLYVEKLLGIHSSYSEIVRAAFQRDAHFDENIDKVRPSGGPFDPALTAPCVRI